MPTVSVVESATPVADAAVVIGAYADPNGAKLAPGGEALDDALVKQLGQAYRRAGGSGAIDELVKVPTLGLSRCPLVAVAGLGSRNGTQGDSTPVFPGERVRRAAGSAVRALAAEPKLRICLTDSGLDDADLVDAVATGALLGGYRFDRYRGGPARRAPKTIAIGVPTRNAATTRAVRRAATVAQAINLARDLVNTPPNDMYPESFVTSIEALAADAGLRLQVFAEKDLTRQGYAGILAVGKGSAHGPRLLTLAYQPARARASVALVGEGTTFNSGGLNLKTAQLALSKADMAGAAAVAATVIAAARLKLPVAVTATIPLAENLPGAAAYRPSDILTMRGGRTVEVADTEAASGRVIVAEAIAGAVAAKPDFLLEASSLTSAQRVALGPNLIAVMGTPQLRDQVTAAGCARGEASWAMPLPAELRAGLSATAADLSTSAPDRWGAMLGGAAFLESFVPATLPWAHLDITGPAWNTGAPRGHTPKGATGAGVATLLAAIESIASPA
jgi:leucyl aminopeptidase